MRYQLEHVQEHIQAHVQEHVGWREVFGGTLRRIGL